jgi:hypothetical protein
MSLKNKIEYPKISNKDLSKKITKNGIILEYKRYNILISCIVDMDGIYLDYFTSQNDTNEARAPKGLAYNYLYQVVEYITKNKMIMKYVKCEEITLTPGDISPKHLVYNKEKLINYYKSIGFNYDKCECKQTIKSFLEIAKLKLLTLNYE